MPTSKQCLCWVLMMGVLAGCRQSSVSDEVEMKLAKVHAVSTPIVTANEPDLAEDWVSFNAKNDPFASPFAVRRQINQDTAKSPMPIAMNDTAQPPEQTAMPMVLGKKTTINPQRPRQPLEHHALSGLKYQGRIEQGGELTAIIVSPDGMAHQAKQGQYIGQNHGKIIQIDRHQIAIAEAYLHTDGQYYERMTSLRFAYDENVE